MSQSTAGKGPGLVLLAENRSGVCRVALSPSEDRALLEVLEQGGRAIAEIGLNARELRDLAAALGAVARALTGPAAREAEEQTELGPPSPPPIP